MSKVQLSLTFTNASVAKSSGEPYFLSDNGIQGKIVIHHMKPRSFELVKISLEGFLVNTIRFADWPKTQQQDSRKLQVLIRMSDIKKHSDFAYDASSKSLKCSFHFHIPQCLGRNLLGEDSEYLADLPASLSVAEVLKEGMNSQKYCLGESRIHYAIRTDVIRDEMAIASLMKPIQILPAMPPPPPICPSDFGSEYTTRLMKSLRGKGRFSITKAGNCTIEATQPASIVLKSLDERITISVPLSISMQNTSSTQTPDDFKEQFGSLLGGEWECNSSLISSSYISVVPRRSIPTQAESDRSNNLTRNASVCSRTAAKIVPSQNWVFNRATSSWDTQAIATLDFSVFRTKYPLLPSFDSSLISHRYRLHLKLEPNTASRISFALDIPIMIRYCSVDNNSGRLSNELPLSAITEGSEEDESDHSSPSMSSDNDEGFRSTPTTLDLQHLLGDAQRVQTPPLHELDLPPYNRWPVETESPPYVI